MVIVEKAVWDHSQMLLHVNSQAQPQPLADVPPNAKLNPEQKKTHPGVHKVDLSALGN